MDNYSVTHVLKNDLGGITSLIRNLIEYRGTGALPQKIILLRIAGNPFATFDGNLIDGVETSFFDFNKRNNWYHSFNKLRECIGNEKGVLISNDTYDLLMLSYYNIPKKVIQIVHDAYNVKLSIKFEAVIDQFICHSYFYFEVLRQLLPERRGEIHFISYGIPILKNPEERMLNDQLKLVFVGRHDKAKGIYDLFEINKVLKENNVAAKWLILGRGPETESVKQQWAAENNIDFYTAKSSEEIIELCMQQDIMVFPTKFEGFPVAMVEAMSVGCVPVVSDLPGGIRELGSKENAIICEFDNNHAFAEGIMKLNKDRTTLKQMSNNCIDYISARHDAVKQSIKYQQFFKEVALSDREPRHHRVKNKLGSRLDQVYIPNGITSFLRRNF